MENLYVIGQTQGACMAIYICKSKEEANKRELLQKERFPLLTVYKGLTNQFGMVIWEKRIFQNKT